MAEIAFALVLTTYLTTGDVQDTIVGIYPDQIECSRVANSYKFPGNCYPVEQITIKENKTTDQS